MFSSLITNVFALAEGESAPWWNIPSFEVWRWVNLIIFVGLFIYILRRPVSEAMRARREGIRRDLMRAQEERNAALAKLEVVETRLARLDAEVSNIHEQSQKEAAEERERIRRSTEEETQKLREQARREIESAGKAARQELREFAAGQSVQLAEEMIRRDIKPEDDARLVSLRVEELGGVKR
jgi:ATP synthase F0 subunit b